MTGKLDVSENRVAFIAYDVQVLSEVRKNKVSVAIIQVNNFENFKSKEKEFKELVRKNEGSCPLKMILDMNGERVLLSLKDEFNNNIYVSPTDDFCNEIEQNFNGLNIDFM